MDKREREQAVFHAVYRDEEFDSVVHQDLPDFLVRHRGLKSQFGVEVTELFEMEADARAHNHPSYIGDLLTGAQPMHKDDLQAFPLSKVKITDKDGNVKDEDVPAIIRQAPSPADHSRAIAHVIERKARRFPKYEEGLSHVNLIIMDWHDRPQDARAEYSSREFLTDELRSALLNCGFREVFLVLTSFQDEQIYRPLQMLLLLESYYLFLEALSTFETDNEDLELEEVIPLFVHAMKHSQLDLTLAPGEKGRCAVYRGTAVEQETTGLSILDFRDRPSPTPVSLPEPPLPPEEMRRLREHVENVVGHNSLMTGLALNVENPVPRYA